MAKPINILNESNHQSPLATNPDETENVNENQIFDYEKPPSPVLNNSKSWKILRSKQLKKSRVKLTDRFLSEGNENTQNFTPSQTENIVESIAIFENIGDWSFRKDQSDDSNKHTESILCENYGNIGDPKNFDFKKPFDVTTTKSPLAFKTANGKLCKATISKKIQSLFDDDLPKKYSFLSKTEVKNLVSSSCEEGFKGFGKDSVEESENIVSNFRLIFAKEESEKLMSKLFERTQPKCSTSESSIELQMDVNAIKTVSGKTELIPKYQDFELSNNSENIQISLFQTGTRKPCTLLKNALNNAQQRFQDLATDSGNIAEPFNGFQTGRRKPCDLSKSALIEAEQRLNDFASNSATITSEKATEVLESGRRKPCTLSNTQQKFQDLATDNGNENIAEPFNGFQTGRRKPCDLSESALIEAEQRLHDFASNSATITSEKTFEVLESGRRKPHTLSNTQQKFQDLATDSGNQEIISEPFNGFQTGTKKPCDLSKSGLIKAERLHAESVSEQFALESSTTSSNSSLLDSTIRPRKRRLGVDTSPNPLLQPSESQLKRARRFFEKELTVSPLRPKAPLFFNSTPVKSAPFAFTNTDLTPIKSVDDVTLVNQQNFGRISIQECTKGTVDDWNRQLESERENLEARLKVVIERQQALMLQKSHLDQNKSIHLGVLFNKKQNKERISLQQLLKIVSFELSVCVTPQNAQRVHFKVTVPYVTVTDGACVIPNLQNLIGLSEIEVAFKALKDVDHKLIPRGWIQNHYKWIIWKLASYENFNFDCLTVDNVIQQLKYRYDREINKAERPPLRRILERDEVSQRRIVLCVSDIYNLGQNKFELELTDGWYSIRTIIDEPLCRQISNNKIIIGTKLVTCWAELLNCADSCYPLNASDSVHLKISCNSTRRVRWYVKLGFQKCPLPIPVRLESVYPNGGVVGCVKVFIARVYPLKYLEKQNTLSVWRNSRAEEVRAQKWESQFQMEEGVNNIKNVHCAKTLYNFCRTINDPEELEESLSHSQKVLLRDYKPQAVSRDVRPLLQLLVIDALNPDGKGYIFQVWNPKESHLEMLKEASICSFSRVLMTKNGNFSVTSQTAGELLCDKTDDFKEYKRTLLPISAIVDKPLFNEFDTVGIVVQISVRSYNQNLWLADSCGSLVFIQIFDGPQNCLLLDKIKTGQVVAIANLIFSRSKEFVEAIANHLTVVSCYPKYKHLEEGINTFQVPDDMEAFLVECNKKISFYISKVEITKDYKNASSKTLVTLESSSILDDSLDSFYSTVDVDELAKK